MSMKLAIFDEQGHLETYIHLAEDQIDTFEVGLPEGWTLRDEHGKPVQAKMDPVNLIRQAHDLLSEARERLETLDDYMEKLGVLIDV